MPPPPTTWEQIAAQITLVQCHPPEDYKYPFPPELAITTDPSSRNAFIAFFIRHTRLVHLERQRQRLIVDLKKKWSPLSVYRAVLEVARDLWTNIYRYDDTWEKVGNRVSIKKAKDLHVWITAETKAMRDQMMSYSADPAWMNWMMTPRSGKWIERKG